jgi:hypothetical protein
MAFDKQAALEAGYTQAEIDAYLQNQSEAPPPPAATTPTGEPPAPTTVVTPAGQGSMLPGVATAGLAAANAAVPAAIGYGVAKYGGRAMDLARNVMQGGGASATSIPTTAPVNPAAINLGANPAVSPSYAAPAAQPAAPQQPGVIQRAMDITTKMRELAAQRAMQFGASGAAVPAAVGMGGAAATGLAGGQMRAMTPEQRKKFYDNPMLGAMGGDAALGAAIMNRGE